MCEQPWEEKGTEIVCRAEMEKPASEKQLRVQSSRNLERIEGGRAKGRIMKDSATQPRIIESFYLCRLGSLKAYRKLRFSFEVLRVIKKATKSSASWGLGGWI